MNKHKTLIFGIFFIILALIFTTCEEPTDPAVTLTGISALYTGTAAVYPSTPLNNLKADLTVTAYYSDNTSKMLSAENYTLDGVLNAGLSVVTVIHKGRTTTFSLTVFAAAITYTAAQTGGVDGITDSTGIVFTFSRSVDSLELTAANITVDGNAAKGTATLSGSGTTRTLAPIIVNGAGPATVSINKTGIEAGTKNITVYMAGTNAPALTEITLNTAPVKKDYIQNEPLDLSGMVVTAHYSDSPSAAVTGYTSNPENGAVLSTTGQITVTIIYTEEAVTRTADFIVNVAPPKTLTEIMLNTVSVNKDYNQNEPLDLSGLVVTAHYSNSSSAAVAGYTSNPENGAILSTTGQITVTIRYTEGTVIKTADFIVNVAPPKTLTEIMLNTVSVKKDYNRNERLDLSGLIVIAHYSDSSNAAVAGYTSNPENGATLSTTGQITVTIRYTEEAVTRTADFKVNVSVPIALEYELITSGSNANTYRVRKGTVTGGAVIIPAAYNGLPVTEIGSADDYAGGWRDPAFYNTGITSIEIPNSVTSIGGSAFSGCTGLTGITIPDSVTSIGSYAFYNCTGLTGITIPASVTSIGSYAFSGCSNLRNIIIDTDKVTTTSSNYWGTRFSADNLSVTFKKNPGNNAFYGCTRLTSVTLTAGVTSIGDYAFQDCTGLTGITISAGVTSIGNRAFFGCTGITSVTFAANSQLTSIGSEAFRGCTSLASITIPAGVTSIGDSAFSGCTNLRNIIIDNDKVTNDGGSNWGTRFPADNLSVTFKKNVGDYAFYSYSNNTRLTSVTLAEGVTSIGSGAFYNCTGITGITILAGVTSIGSRAFYGCTGLTGITIPASVTSISGSAFYGCTGLTGINIPDSVTSIGGSAFGGCTGLTGITIPENVTSIGDGAFSGCTALRNIVIDTDKVMTTEYSNWGTRFPADNLSVTFKKNVGDYAFYIRNSTNTRLTSVTLAEGVTSIGTQVFYGCTGLTSITFAAGSQLMSIGNNAFYGCTSLTGITIPENVTSVGSQAFYGCTGLTSITIPASVTTIGSSAFYYWTNAQTIYVEGYASQSAADSAWGSSWRQNCYAQIVYNADKAAGATVAAPTLASKTATSVTLNAVAAPSNGQTVEYTKNNSNTTPSTGWQTDRSFTGLTAATTYYFFARAAENTNYYAGAASADLSVTTDKASGTTVAAPTLNSKTTTSVTLNAVAAPSNGQTVEYARNSSNNSTSVTWQISTAFTGLTAGTTYYFFARAAENVTYNAGAASGGLSVTTDKNTGATVAAPTLNSKTTTSVTVNAVNLSTATGQSIEYGINTTNAVPTANTTTNKWQTSTTFTGLTAGTTYYFFARAAENAAYNAGAASDGTQITPDKNTGATVAAPTAGSRTATSVTLNTVTASTGQTVEYARNNSNTAPSTGWQTDRNFTGLTAATTYYFFARAAENSSYYAGAASAGTAITTLKNTGATVAAPTLSSKYQDSVALESSVTLNAITSTSTGQTVQYARSNSNTAPSAGSNDWQTSTYFSRLTPGTTYYFFARTAENDTYYAGAASAGTAIDLDKYTGAIVAAPTTASITANSVTLNTITSTSTGQTVQYARNTANTVPSTGWQTSATFTGLTPVTTYYFFARAAENAYCYAGAASAGTAITTNKSTGAAVEGPTLNTRTMNSITLNAITASTGQTVEYGINTANTAPSIWQDSVTFTGLNTGTIYYFFARAAENAYYNAGAVSSREITTDSPAIPLEMVWVPGGSFQMGKDLGTAATGDVTPVHTVTLTGFYMGKYEVTQAQYKAVMGSVRADGDSGFGNNYPVYHVSWYEALVFCNKLSIAEGLTPAYRIGYIGSSTDPDDWGIVPTSSNATWNAVEVVSGSTGYRLPTEAQWEYAAKGGNGSPGNYTYAGSDNPDDVAWRAPEYFLVYHATSYEVGTKAPNGLGLYDMSGNVSELCWDWYGDYSSGAQTNPTGASSGSYRVTRGGSVGLYRDVRSVYRDYNGPYGGYYDLGFRLVRPAQ